MLTDRLARTLEVVTVVDGVLFLLELLKVIACIVILSNAEDPSETSSLPMEQPAVVHVFSKSLEVIIAQALFTALVFLFQQEHILLNQIKLSLSHSLTRKCIRNWHNFVFTALEAGALLIVWTNETAYDSTLFNVWIALLFFFRFIELWLGTILAGAGGGGGWCRAVRFDAICWVYVRMVFFLLVGCQSVACELRGRLFGSILSSSFAQYMALYKEIPAVAVSAEEGATSPTETETAAPPSPPSPPAPPAPPTRSCTWDIMYTVFLFKICIAIAVVSVILSNVAVASNDDTSGPYSIDTCDRDCRLRDFHFTLKLCAAALSLYALQMALTAWCNRYHPTIRPYDAFVDMVIGFDLNAAVLTFLLDPFLCLVSSLDCAADILVFVAYEHSHVTPKYGRLLAMFFVMLLTCTPVLLVGQRLWRKTAHRPAQWRFSAVVMALTCADVIVLFLLTRATQVAVMPVSLLSFLSRLRTRYFPAKHQQALGTERPSEMVSSSPSPSPSKGDPLLLSLAFRRAKWIDDPPTTPRWVTWRRALVKLCSRYTVVYSLLKMLTCIAYSLIANQGYRSCSLDAWGTYGDPLSCQEPLACRAFCPGWSYLSEGAQHGYSHPPQFTYDDAGGSCTVEVAGNCTCTNWWIFQFLVILGHLVHFGIQCWFYVHYDHFDPQQHQILCVEQYALVGDNVTWLFTYPAMGWLAVVEFGILVLVWVEVFTHNGSYCVHPGSYELNASNSALVWAVLNTFVEIYKANLSIATRAREQGQWVRMGAALVRVDLFVFYASTLVFQTLLFPISVFAAVFTALTQDPEAEKAENAVGGGDVPRPVDAVDRGSAPHDSESFVRPSASGSSSSALSLSAALNPLQHPSAVVELRHSSSHSDPRSTTTSSATTTAATATATATATAGAHDDV